MRAVVQAAFGVGLLGVVAAIGRTATQPAETGAAGAELEQCMQHCRVTFTSIEHTLRLIERAQNSHDPGELRNALAETKTQLVEMRKQVGGSMAQLETIRNGSSFQVRAAAEFGASWACPMHRQVRQDRPGNCPICDVTLRSVPVGTTSAQPAFAVLPGPEHGDPEASIRRATTAR